MDVSSDTIAAKATPPGKGGVGIIRISGNEASSVAINIIGLMPKIREATFASFKQEDGSVIDQGLVLFFKGPHSFTGEDVLELQGHGGTIVMDMLLQRVLSLGVRLARPGEFSERAFLNNKLDLTQAEAIADLIDASSVAAARSAMQSLQGHFSKEINQLVEQVTLLRMYVEAAIDFPDEEIDFLSDGNVLAHLEKIQLQLNHTLAKTKQGAVLNEGLKVVIIGYPNAGKSSLMNFFSGEETAIVSEIPGTTRDILKEHVLIDGMPLKIIDTAGLRNSADILEEEGIKRAWKEIPFADRILLVIDASETPIEKIQDHALVKELHEYSDKLSIVRNKIDLTEEVLCDKLCNKIINISVKTGQGMTDLIQHLKQCIGYDNQETAYLARRRHLDSLHRAKRHFDLAVEQLVVRQAGELVAEELRHAQNVLSEITGEFRSDDLLGKIFSSFCIGK